MAKKSSSKIKIILEILKEVRSISAQALSSRYSSYSTMHLKQKMNEMQARRSGWRPREEVIEAQKRKEEEKFYKLLSYLRHRGYVAKRKDQKAKNNFWDITKDGAKKLEALILDDVKQDYFSGLEELEKDFLKVIVFDIPEYLKAQRYWIVFVLRKLGFEKLQRSVWIGEAQVPEKLFYEFRKRKISDCIHILAVQDAGTLYGQYSPKTEKRA